MYFETNAGTAKVATLVAKLIGAKVPAKTTTKSAVATVPTDYKRVHYGNLLRRNSFSSHIADVKRMLGIKAD